MPEVCNPPCTTCATCGADFSTESTGCRHPYLRTIDFLVNPERPQGRDAPRRIERATLTLGAVDPVTRTPYVTVRNRAGAELRLDIDAAIGLALVLREEYLRDRA